MPARHHFSLHVITFLLNATTFPCVNALQHKLEGTPRLHEVALDFTQLLHQTKEWKGLLSIVVFSFLECAPVPENSNDRDDTVTEKASFLAEHRAQERGKERRGTESSADASSSSSAA